jgi:hypothetical protein
MSHTPKQLAIYQAPDGQIQIDVRLDADTIWLTQKLMAELFNVTIATINEHLRHIFISKELSEQSVIRKFRITASDGKKYNTKHYNLDAIISIGYRVNSKTATKFRIRATQTLKQHITQGYTINRKQVARNYEAFLQAVESVKALAHDKA